MTNFLNYNETQTEMETEIQTQTQSGSSMPDGVWGSFKFVASEIYEAYNFHMQHLLHFVWPGLLGSAPAMSLCLKCLCK